MIRYAAEIISIDAYAVIIELLRRSLLPPPLNIFHAIQDCRLRHHIFRRHDYADEIPLP